MKKRKNLVGRLMPSNPEALSRVPMLGRVWHLVSDRKLWAFRRDSVAAGVAIGAFFAIATPLAQIPASVILATKLRANIPTAVAATFLNTPPTFAPVYYAAYLVGSFVLGRSHDAEASAVVAAVEGGLTSWTGEVAICTIAGAQLLAAALALAAYTAVHLGWKLSIRRRAARWRRIRKATVHGSA